MHHDGDTPALFKEGAPVVVEGHWASTAKNAPFDSDRILIRHGADYTPPKVDTDTKKAANLVKAALGYAAVALGAGASVVGITLLLAGMQLRDRNMLAFGRRCVFAVFVAAIAAAGVMEWALLSHDFSIRYVAENNATGTPVLYTITGLWAALEGSILLWAVILGGYLTFVAWKFRHRATDRIVVVATITGLVVALFFFALMLGPANPFHTLASVPVDGRGPNPLLQNHVLMAFHPPILYMGYVGFTVPFMFGIAALVTGRFGEGWLADTRRATLVAWGFLTVGIILGAWWSYEVLGWGGFWAWDPVENASLLPWLTGTAFIHSVIVQERRGMLRVWNLSLVIATFCLTILGTFLTRSGVIDSVHAFTQSDIGPWLLAFLGVVAATGIGLVAWRGDRLRAPGRIDSAVSRESAFLANNLLFAALAFVVLLGTVFPLVAEAVRGSRLSVGEPYFDRMATPIGLALLFLMAAAPALPWRATSGDVVRHRLLVPAWIGGLTMLIAVMLGARGLAEILAYGLGAFATAGIVRQFALGIRGRRRALGESRHGRPRTGDPIEPATLRRSRRALRGRAHRGGARGVLRLRRQPRREAPARPVSDGVGLHVDLSGLAHRELRPEGDRLGRRAREEGRPGARHVRARDLHLPEQHRGDRHAVGAHRHRRRRLPHADLGA